MPKRSVQFLLGTICTLILFGCGSDPKPEPSSGEPKQSVDPENSGATATTTSPDSQNVSEPVAPAKSQPAARVPQTLFDGSTLEGWEGNLEIFRVEDSAIVGGTLERKIAHNEFLTSKREYADFELRLKFRLKGANTNAGVQIRSRRTEKPAHEMIGYQADLGQQYWGCLYDESRRRKVLAEPNREELNLVLKPNNWNDYRIRCEGKRIQLWINGYQTVDYTEEDDTLEQTGLIGLQIHGGPPGEAWYKDIEIDEL